MQDEASETELSAITLSAVVITVFRHKWKIFTATIVGIIAAVAFSYSQVPNYQSDAKLLVRYVLDRSSIDPVESSANGSRATDSVIGSEVEILTSWDLAMQVAESIGVDRMFPDVAGASKVDAAANILSGLSVTALKNSNVILVSYKNRNPALATEILEGLVKQYFKKHLDVHRSAGAFEFVTQQTDLVRSRLSATEDELKTQKAKAHVISLTESTTDLSNSLAKTQDEMYEAEAESAEQRARVLAAERMLIPGPVKSAAGGSRKDALIEINRPGVGEIQQYEVLNRRLIQMRQMELDLLSKYTPENELVKRHQLEIIELEKQRIKLNEKYPNFAVKHSEESQIQNQTPDIDRERTKLAGIEARIGALKARDLSLKERAAEFAELAPKIAQLERKKGLEEADYKYFGASLEKARIDEALDPAKMPNISEVQKPTPAMKVTSGRIKVLFGLIGGGVTCGIAIAFLIDFVFDSTVKLPIEIESRLRLPLLLCIPFDDALAYLKNTSRTKQLANLEQVKSSDNSLWDAKHSIRQFSEILRDRLVLYFELKKMVYKPKLIAVTSCSGGGGVSTVAAGLATALSETGEGKILLVDLNVGSDDIHRHFEGRQVSTLIDAIEGGSSIPAAKENLYLAKAAPTAGASQIIPKRFYDLVPNFKATDFDYIIFDMPPLSQGSIALAMSGFMDKVLLVVEAEENPRHVVKKTFSDLVAANADVAIVFNKIRSYGPRSIQGGL